MGDRTRRNAVSALSDEAVLREIRDRRNTASRTALIERFRAEFREMPGLWVTQAQARRLFGAPEDICQRVLDALVREGTLIRTKGGVYHTPPRTTRRRE